VIESHARALGRRAAIAAATREALGARGTVMLEPPGRARRWCAVCASVQGDLEVRVGEPQPGWPPGRRRRRERWREEHGFAHRIDAWSRPLPRSTSADDCARLLDEALDHGLGLAPEAELRRRLVHPGISGHGPPPSPGASYADHLAAAFGALATAGGGRAGVECGRPARALGRVAVADGALILDIESVADPGTDQPLGRFECSAEGAAAAARALASALDADFGCAQPEPLFVSLFEVG